MSSYTHFEFTFMTIKFSLHLINFTPGSSFYHALNLSYQRHQHNYSFLLPYNRKQFQNNNIMTKNHARQTRVIPLGVLLVQIKSPYFKVTWNSYSVNTDKLFVSFAFNLQRWLEITSFIITYNIYLVSKSNAQSKYSQQKSIYTCPCHPVPFLLPWWQFSRQVMSNSCNTMDCCLPGSSVYGIFQAILEQVAISFPGNLPDSGTEPTSPALQVISYVAGGFFTN